MSQQLALQTQFLGVVPVSAPDFIISYLRNRLTTLSGQPEPLLALLFPRMRLPGALHKNPELWLMLLAPRIQNVAKPTTR